MAIVVTAQADQLAMGIALAQVSSPARWPSFNRLTKPSSTRRGNKLADALRTVMVRRGFHKTEASSMHLEAVSAQEIERGGGAFHYWRERSDILHLDQRPRRHH